MRVTVLVLHKGDTWGMRAGIYIGSEGDGYRLKVGGCSGDEGRY